MGHPPGDFSERSGRGVGQLPYDNVPLNTAPRDNRVSNELEEKQSVEATITRLTREIAKIDEVFYMVNETKDRVLYAGMLERKRDDMIRSAVLQMHTAIEDLLNSQIICRVLNVRPEDRARRMRSKSAQALRSMLVGPRSLGFETKLNFAVVLGLVRQERKIDLPN